MPITSRYRYIDASVLEQSWNTFNGPIQPPTLTNRKLTAYESRDDGGPVAGWRYKTTHATDATSYLLGRRQNYVVRKGLRAYTIAQKDQYGAETGEIGSVRSGVTVSVPSAPYPGGLSTADADREAVMRFVKNIKNAQRSVQSLVSLGELGETLRMIRNPAKSLFQGLFGYHRAVKKRLPRTPLKRRSKVVADTWLEYSFGWSPLVKDVYGAAKALAKINTGLVEHEYVRGEGTVDALVSDDTYSSQSGFSVIRERTVTKTQVKVIYRGVVGVKTGGYANPNLAQFGVDWRELVPTVWELIPWSFLVDYFSNIGAILEAYSVNYSSIYWKNRTIIQRGISTVSDVGFSPISLTPFQSIKSFQHSTSSVIATDTIVERASHTGLLIPTLGFEIPGLSRRWLNISALALLRR